VDNAVLFVGDEATALNALAHLFLNRDVRVLRAGDGEEALGIVRKEPVASAVSASRTRPVISRGVNGFSISEPGWGVPCAWMTSLL